MSAIQHPIRIGLIGASPNRGWAAMAHVPAIRDVPGLTLQAVATRSEATARAAAQAFGAPLGFGDAAALIEHPDVDAVVVAVKAPDHFELVRLALLAGKPVHYEWPFSRTIEETRELEALAREHNVVTAIGLQGRFSPWLRQVRDIVASGRLGRILSSSMLAWDELSVGTVDQGNVYLLDVASGANPLTIHSGHHLDALTFCLGDLQDVRAMTAIGRKRVVVRQTQEIIAPTSPDQVVVLGRLDGGALATLHMRAGSGDPSFRWEIQGEDAVLRVTCAGYLMWRPLDLVLWDVHTKRWEDVAAPDVGRFADGPAGNVTRLYAAFAADILTGSRQSVSFTDALASRELVETVRMAAVGAAND